MSFLSRLFLSSKPPEQYNIGDVIILPYLMPYCIDGGMGVMLYDTGTFISEPYIHKTGTWVQALSFDTEIVPDHVTFISGNLPPSFEWVTNPPAVEWVLQKKNPNIKIKSSAVDIVGSGGDDEKTLFFEDKSDSNQDKHVLSSIPKKRQNKMIKAWDKWMLVNHTSAEDVDFDEIIKFVKKKAKFKKIAPEDALSLITEYIYGAKREFPNALSRECYDILMESKLLSSFLSSKNTYE